MSRKNRNPRDAREKEISKILCGFIAYYDDGIRAAKGLINQNFQGFFASFTEIGIFGLCEKRHQFRLPSSAEPEQLKKALIALGSEVVLESAPDAAAVLCLKSFFFNPAVLTLETKGKNNLICFYSAKSPFAEWNCRKRLEALAKRLEPAKLNEVSVTLSPQVVEPEQPEKPGLKQLLAERRNAAAQAEEEYPEGSDTIEITYI